MPCNTNAQDQQRLLARVPAVAMLSASTNNVPFWCTDDTCPTEWRILQKSFGFGGYSTTAEAPGTSRRCYDQYPLAMAAFGQAMPAMVASGQVMPAMAASGQVTPKEGRLITEVKRFVTREASGTEETTTMKEPAKLSKGMIIAARVLLVLVTAAFVVVVLQRGGAGRVKSLEDEKWVIPNGVQRANNNKLPLAIRLTDRTQRLKVRSGTAVNLPKPRTTPIPSKSVTHPADTIPTDNFAAQAATIMSTALALSPAEKAFEDEVLVPIHLKAAKLERRVHIVAQRLLLKPSAVALARIRGADFAPVLKNAVNLGRCISEINLARVLREKIGRPVKSRVAHVGERVSVLLSGFVRMAREKTTPRVNGAAKQLGRSISDVSNDVARLVSEKIERLKVDGVNIECRISDARRSKAASFVVAALRTALNASKSVLATGRDALMKQVDPFPDCEGKCKALPRMI